MDISSWLSALAILILCRLNCMCYFPIWCLGQDVELIVSVPERCLLSSFIVVILGPSQNVTSVLAI